MKKKVWERLSHSFEKARLADDEYYRYETPAERLSDMQFIREQYYKIGRSGGSTDRKGFRRVVRIVKQK